LGNIIWLASYQKSGNTWVRVFLHHLFTNADKPLGLPDTRGGEVSASASSLPWYRTIDKRPPESWTSEDVAAMRPKVQQMIAASRRGSVFCKTHVPLMVIHGQPTIDMSVTAGAVYIVRDPRDIAVSFADFHGIKIDAAITALATENLEVPASDRQIAEPLGGWSQHVASWTARPSPAIHVIRYEDLHGDPTGTFTRLAAFLRLDASPERIERAAAHSSFKTLRTLEDRHGFDERSPVQERFFRKGVAGGWREELTAEQAGRIETDHAAQMARFGYLPESS
jgi:Sulfotransferase domain